MAMRYGGLRRISRFLPHIYSGNYCQHSRHAIINTSASSLHPLPREREKISGNGVTFSFSTISQASPPESTFQADVLPFIESTLNELQGRYHCWFNVVEVSKDFFKRDGAFLVLAGQFLDNSSSQIAGCDTIAMCEKVKSIQQRFPQLQVMGFLHGCSTSSAVDRDHLVEMVMKEYITFPILLSNKNFPEMANGVCYILFKSFGNARVYYEKGLDFGMLKKAVEELNLQQNENSGSPNNLKSTWVKQAEVFKEPYTCLSVRNLLFHFPGCISADEDGGRLFLSDSNHHRIVIFDGNGKILDCIGYYPGFEDGEFETAKLVRPAASFYYEDEDCLYIVDSENHAIRRADMGRRVLETLYPTCSISKKDKSLWTWIVNKLGFGSENDMKSEEFDHQSLIFPWHLLKSEDDNLLIINRSFETLWIMDLASGVIKEVVTGFSKVLEICRQLIMEKVSLVKQMPQELLVRQIESSCSLKELPYVGLISSLVAFQNDIIMCDTVDSAIGRQRASIDHIQCFSLLPGKIGIKLNVNIPSDTELVEPLQEGCIWRQARGAATEVSGSDEVAGSSEKVGVAQQWYDELDTLAFAIPESESNIEDDSATSDLTCEDDTVHIACAVNTSPGTSEVIICAALYLKLRRYRGQENSQEKSAARIADLLKLEKNGGIDRDSFIRLLLRSNQDLKDVIFMKPIHVMIKLDCLDHPKADNSKDIILTDSNIEVNVSMNT